MASLAKKRGASGALSPYWQAILSFNHRKIWISTKCTDRRIAKSVSERWTRACWLAGRWELNQQRCDRLLSEIQAVTKCPATLDNSRELFKRLMRETTGEAYLGENLSDHGVDCGTAKGDGGLDYQEVRADFKRISGVVAGT